ncbi:AraC family transcriptional regulator [Uruburuella testudinis]|uniref:AraC family transcriptional regulator n=1 Tax=Uruburuella testudinis TaxID=1282863 RepID=A0ABY4DYE1_9NEIS|nr:AraC family transcriptional regulator [Uruburuella testudinis]UOO83079.1 AraC family transcriptional regulator [Uruburuella testudinis]
MNIQEHPLYAGGRHFSISGEQQGEVLLYTLHHGIEYKYAVTDTMIDHWHQPVCFTPDLRLVITLQGNTHLRMDRQDFRVQTASGGMGMLLPMIEPVAGEKVFQRGRQNELVLFFSRFWLEEWCGHNPVLRRALLRAHLQPHYFAVNAPVMRQVCRLLATHDLPAAWRRFHQEAQSIALLAEVLQLLFADAADNSRPALGGADKRIARLAEMLHDSAYEHYTLTELARACHSNATTLQRDFFNAYGQSIDQYRRAYKLHLAREALRQGMPIAQAARAGAYTNLQSFGRAFKKQFGCSPGACRPRVFKAGQRSVAAEKVPANRMVGKP